MAADLRLIVHAAEGDARKLAVCGARNAHGDAGFARARRADETQHAALCVRGELAHGQRLNDAVFHLFQPEMILIEDLSGLPDVQCFLGADVPRKVQAHIQIVADDRSFRRAERLLFQAVDLLEQPLLGVLRKLQRLDLRPVFVQLLRRIVRLAKLALDDLELLAQQILLLRLIHALLCRLLQTALQVQHLDLTAEHFRELCKPAARPQFLQQLLLLLRTEVHMLRNEICHERGVRAAEDVDDRLRREIARCMDIVVKQIAAVADERFNAGRASLLRIRQRVDYGHEAGRRRCDRRDLAPDQALHHDADGLVAGLLHHLLDAADRADCIHIVRRGHVGRHLLLRGEENNLILAHRLIQRRDRHGPLHVKIQQHAGKHGQPAQRHHRQLPALFKFVIRILHSASPFKKGAGEAGDAQFSR